MGPFRPIFENVDENRTRRKQTSDFKAINNGLACSVLFLSTTGLFPARRKILEHETQSSALTFSKCSKQSWSAQKQY